MSVDTEAWKMHPKFVDYEISTQGRVRRLTPKKGTRAGRIKTSVLNTTGYSIVSIDAKPRKVHVLVLETFVGPRPKGYDACHKDGSRTNNTLSNLKWATRVENMADARRHGTDMRCDRHPSAKLDWPAVVEIRKCVSEGELYKYLALRFGVSRAHISYVVNRGWNP